MRRCLFGRARREELYWYRPIVAEREADLAVVLVRGRHNRGGRSRQYGDGRSGPRVKGRCVMMPGEQNSLEEDRENTGERAGPALRSPCPTGPTPVKEAHPHPRS